MSLEDPFWDMGTKLELSLWMINSQVQTNPLHPTANAPPAKPTFTARDFANSKWQSARMVVDIGQLANALVALGCPAEKSAEMAAQLDKRARQLAEQRHRSYEEAMAHLLGLMKQGWAAKEKGH